MSISVIIPTHNRGQKLFDSVSTVLYQTYTDWELIIIDDGSTDETRDVVRKIQMNNSRANIRYIYQDNAGPAVARNRGVEAATMDNIVYLDDDDAFTPDALFKIEKALEDEAVMWGVTDRYQIIQLVDRFNRVVLRDEYVLSDFMGEYQALGGGDTGVEKKNDVSLQDIYNLDFIANTNGTFHRRSLFDQGLRWNTEMPVAREDLEFLLQMGAKWPEGYKYIPYPLVIYKQTQGTNSKGLVSQSTHALWAYAYAVILELHADDPLMRHPLRYLDLVENCMNKASLVKAGRHPPHILEYFSKYKLEAMGYMNPIADVQGWGRTLDL